MNRQQVYQDILDSGGGQYGLRKRDIERLWRDCSSKHLKIIFEGVKRGLGNKMPSLMNKVLSEDQKHLCECLPPTRSSSSLKPKETSA